jgi:hypothetical protein
VCLCRLVWETCGTVWLTNIPVGVRVGCGRRWRFSAGGACRGLPIAPLAIGYEFNEGVLMNRKVMGLMVCLVAAFAVSAVASAVASAVTMTLPVFSGTATSYTGTSGRGLLSIEGGASISCSADTASGTFGSTRSEGPGSITFTGCQESTAEGAPKCKSLAGTLGTITSTGTWNLVLKLDGSTDLHYLQFLLPIAGLHIECPGGTVTLFLILGAALGAITQKTGSTTSFSVKVSSTTNVQEFSEYENDSGTLVKVSLKVGEEGGKEKAGFENDEEGLIDFPSATSIEK